jgi:hypothetical protein
VNHFRLNLPVAFSVLALALASCATDEHDDHANATPESEACEHLAGTASKAVTALTVADADKLADVSTAHTRFDVTLPADASGTYAGYVKFLAPTKGDYLLVANAAVPLQVIDSAGVAVVPTSTTSTGACSAVATQLVLPLGVATYRVKIGPHSKATVGLLFEAK